MIADRCATIDGVRRVPVSCVEENLPIERCAGLADIGGGALLGGTRELNVRQQGEVITCSTARQSALGKRQNVSARGGAGESAYRSLANHRQHVTRVNLLWFFKAGTSALAGHK